MRERRLLTLAVVMIMVMTSVALVGCKPGYREIWEPVKVPTFEWDDNGDIAIIKDRIASDLHDNEIDVDAFYGMMKPDGTFKGYDYSNPKKRPSDARWIPLEHLRGVEKLLVAYSSEGHKYYQDESIKSFVHNALAFWVDKDFYCAWSGWNNDIGLGLTIPNTLLLEDGIVEESDRDKLLARVVDTSLAHEKVRFKLYNRPVNETGGNLTDQVIASLKIACIGNDGSLIKWLTSLLENEMQFFPDFDPRHHRWDAEGIKEDWSFNQHDQYIYFGGYGEVMLSGMNRYLRYTRDTQYALSDEKVDFYARSVLNGMQYATRNGYRDISASGRGIARKNGLKGIYNQVKEAVLLLLDLSENSGTELDPATLSELERVKRDRIDRIEAGESDKGAGGHKYYYMSDYNVMNCERYMATVRHASKRTRVYEYLNYENYLGYYTGMGATFYYVDGDEYYNLPPVYDWNKIPGTTTRQGKVPTLGQDASYNRYGATDYVMGVSNGRVGMSYFKMTTDGVKANKAYFMFEDGVVCLGSDINASSGKGVITNINQTTLDGDVIIAQNGAISSNKNVKGKVDYIYHDKIAYFPANDIVLTLDKGRKGDWNRIFEGSKSDPHTADIFNLDIDHGTKVKNGTYAYTVLMNVTEADANAYSLAPTIKILANTKDVQAVMDTRTNTLEAVFHKGGAIVLPNGSRLALSDGCVLILEGNKMTIASHDFMEREITIALGSRSVTKTISRRPVTIEL